MALATSSRISVHNPVVETAVFLVGFPLFEDGDLAVYIDGQETEDYSVSADYENGRADDAEIELSEGVSGVSVTIAGDRAPRREANHLGNASNLSEKLQRDLDRIVASIQELWRKVGNSARVLGDGEVAPISLSPEERAQTILGFGNDGTTLVAVPRSDLGGEGGTGSGTANRIFDSLQAMLDSTHGETSAGSVWRSGHSIWEVANSSANDYHQITAGDVKLYEAGNQFSTLARFKHAVTRGNSWLVNEIVHAGGLSYIFLDDDNTDLDGLPGWSYRTLDGGDF